MAYPSDSLHGAGNTCSSDPDSGDSKQLLCVKRSPVRKTAGFFSLRRLQDLAGKFFPNSSPCVVCPDGPVPRGPHPPLIVDSLMRSGTHLAIDAILNNLPEYRNHPLYVDFDRYVYEGYEPSELLRQAGSCIIKTHLIQRPFTEGVTDLLKSSASRGLVIIPSRSAAEVQRSLEKWGYGVSVAALEKAQERQMEFWRDHDPLVIGFRELLKPESCAAFLAKIRERIGLPAPSADHPLVVADSSRFRNLQRKLRTRMQGRRAPVINTTIGFRL